MHLSRLPLFAALCALLIASPALAGYERINEPNPNDAANVHIYELDNGFTVYLSENHEKPEFYAEIAVRVGYKHDPPETTGLAHYLEHLLFKGTQQLGTADWEKEKSHIDRIETLYQERFAETDPAIRDSIYALINKESQLASQYAIPNEYDRLYQSMGSTYLNAHTWYEETVYKVGLPSNRLEQWAMVETERFRSPVYRLFQPELEIVYEEKNRAMDNKERIINEVVDKALFKVHPYGQQTGLGTVEHLKNPSLRNIHEFYEAYYVPANMAIIVAGDIQADKAIKVIDRHFGRLPKGDLPKPKTWDEPPFDGVERVEATYEGEEKVIIAFRTVPNHHPDAAAVTIADELLDNRRAGLMNRLVQRQEVREASASRMLLNDHGGEQFEGVPKKGQTLEEVEALLLAQIETLKKGDFDEELIDAIVNNEKKKKKSGMESNNERVATMRRSYIAYKNWDESVAELDRLSEVTKEDVVRVAKKHFGKNYVVGYRRDAPHAVPKIEKPRIDPIDIDVTKQSDFAKHVSSLGVTDIEPDFVEPSDYTVIDYAPGARLFYSRNPLNDLFVFRISVDLGFNQDNRIQFAQKLLDVSGTGDLSAEDLKAEWFKLATDFSFGTGDDTSWFSISGLDENFAESLALMRQIINKPKASKETLDEMIAIILANREDTKKNPRAIRHALALYNSFGAQSRYLRMLDNEKIQNFQVKELHGLARGLLGYMQTLFYVGSLPLDEVIESLKSHHPIRNELKDPPPYLSMRIQSPEKDVLKVFHKEMAQSQVYVEFAGIEYDEIVVPDAQIFSEYFSGGMSGLVFQEIRESRALAYAVGAAYTYGQREGDQNAMWGGLGTQADKTREAVEAFLDLLDKMPVTQERFDSAKEALVNVYKNGKTSFREVLGAVRSWERLGLEPDPRRKRFETIKQADLGTLTSFHKAHIKGRPRLISVVGDTSKIDVERLNKIATPELVSLEDIFIF